jgi:hypothetical protein
LFNITGFNGKNGITKWRELPVDELDFTKERDSMGIIIFIMGK